MRLDHPIFQGPLPVAIATHLAPTPDNYRLYPEAEGLGAQVAAWRVETPDYPDVEPGLVSDAYGFEDSPDSEWISGGLNSKGPTAMALGRQANLFLWGFAAAPSELTDSARAVLVNAIAYMDQFDGVAPLVTRSKERGLLGGREHALLSAHYLGLVQDADRAAFQRRFPPSVVQATALDPERTLAYYRGNLEFLIPAQGQGYELDEACLRLSVGNRDARFLPELIARLEADPTDAHAQGLLQRYAPSARGLPAQELRSWYDRARPFLYFTDRGGFEWRVDEPASRAGAPRARTGHVFGRR